MNPRDTANDGTSDEITRDRISGDGIGSDTGLSSQPAADESESEASITSGQRRVLIVDDEEDFTLMMCLTLQQTGRYETLAENFASRALDTARGFRPELILLDVMMPEMDGGDVLAMLQTDPATRNIPVIFLTALVGGDETPVGGLVSAGHYFVPKPVSVADLTRTMDEVLAEK